MYLDTFGSVARVPDRGPLAPGLNLAWAHQGQMNPVADETRLLGYGSARITLFSAAGGEVWSIAGTFKAARFLGDRIVAVRETEGTQIVEVRDAATSTVLTSGPVEHSLDALAGDVIVGHRQDVAGETNFHAVLGASRVDANDISPIWRAEVRGGYDGVFSRQFAIGSGRVLIGRGYELVAIDMLSGSCIWASSVKDLGGTFATQAQPMSVGDFCVVATQAWTGAFEAKTGKRLWSTPIWGSRVVYGDRVYVIQHDTFYAFDLFDGSTKVEYNLQPEMEKKGRRKFQYIATALSASDTHIWCGDPFGTLWALNRETGRPEWHHRPKVTTGYMGGVPAISGNRLYIPSFSMDPRFPPSLYCYEQA